MKQPTVTIFKDKGGLYLKVRCPGYEIGELEDLKSELEICVTDFIENLVDSSFYDDDE